MCCGRELFGCISLVAICSLLFMGGLHLARAVGLSAWWGLAFGALLTAGLTGLLAGIMALVERMTARKIDRLLALIERLDREEATDERIAETFAQLELLAYGVASARYLPGVAETFRRTRGPARPLLFEFLGKHCGDDEAAPALRQVADDDTDPLAPLARKILAAGPAYFFPGGGSCGSRDSASTASPAAAAPRETAAAGGATPDSPRASAAPPASPRRGAPSA
jgi:hypothetical protein